MATRLATRPSTNGRKPTTTPRLPPPYDKATVEIEMITPEMAGSWLETQQRNRGLRDSRVLWLRGIISRKGEWKLSDSCIVFDTKGRLINGQHRLTAIEEGTVAVPVVVLRGVPTEAQNIMDTSLQRSIGDALKQERNQSNVNALATGLRWIAQMNYIVASEGADVHYSNSGMVPTTPQLLAIFDECGEEVVDIVKWSTKYRIGLKLRPGPMVPIVMMQRKLSMEDTQVFWDSLLTGADLAKDSPLLLLRNALQNDARGFGGKKMPTYRQAALICKAWNLWREGDTRQSLTWHYGGRQKDTFPIPI